MNLPTDIVPNNSVCKAIRSFTKSTDDFGSCLGAEFLDVSGADDEPVMASCRRWLPEQRLLNGEEALILSAERSECSSHAARAQLQGISHDVTYRSGHAGRIPAVLY